MAAIIFSRVGILRELLDSSVITKMSSDLYPCPITKVRERFFASDDRHTDQEVSDMSCIIDASLQGVRLAVIVDTDLTCQKSYTKPAHLLTQRAFFRPVQVEYRKAGSTGGLSCGGGLYRTFPVGVVITWGRCLPWGADVPTPGIVGAMIWTEGWGLCFESCRLFFLGVFTTTTV